MKSVATCVVPGPNMTTSVYEMTPKRMTQLDQLLAKLHATCGRMGLVNEALTHNSYVNENPGAVDYERLEFFGDAVLKFVISEYLLDRFGDYSEGQLTEIRAALVSDKTLSEIGLAMGLDRYILLGRQVQMKPSIVANALEALIGAIYQDQGLFLVQNMVVSLFSAHATAIDRSETKDNFKAHLQEYTQGLGLGLPIYTVLANDGPAHEPSFTMSVSVSGEPKGLGTGPSKKSAEQEAARAALEILEPAKCV